MATQPANQLPSSSYADASGGQALTQGSAAPASGAVGAPQTVLAFQAGQASKIRIEAGNHYAVRRAVRASDPDALEVPDNLIATRQGDALHLRYADGSTLTFENFYTACTTESACSVNLVSDSEAGLTLNASNASGAAVSGDSGTLVYAHGNQDVLMSMAQGQANVVGSFAALGDAPVLTYWPASPAAGSATAAGSAVSASASTGLAVIPALIGGGILIGAGATGASASEGNHTALAHVDSVAELQPLADAVTAIMLAAAGGTPPTLQQLQLLGLDGVVDGNLAAVLAAIAGTADDGINDALATSSIAGTQADTPAEIQTLVDAYKAILAEANGATADATPGVNPTATQYASIGADIGAAATDAENLTLLNDLIGSQASTGVDTVAEINELARIANAIQLTASGGTPSPALTAADLALIGITGVTTGNLSGVLQSIANQSDTGTATDSLPELQTLVNTVITAVAATDNTLNASEQGAAISGTAEANSVITLTLSGVSHSVTTDGAGNWSYTLQPADISAMGQGPETVSVTATDAAGNVSAAGTRNITIDTVAPTLAVGTIAGDSILNKAEHDVLDAANRLLISGTTSGVEDGQTVSITLNYLQYSTTVTGNTWSLANLPTADALALNHGNSYTATASVTDAAGNVSNVGSASVLIDIATPDSHDGSINNGAELFGNGTLLADGSHAANGFEALAQFDTNQDDKIDAQDAVFQELKVWRDANGDGVSQAAELQSLHNLGIASFNLTAATNNSGENGNLHGLVSGYTTTDGAVHGLADVWFQQGAQFTLESGASGLNILHMASHAQGLDLSTVNTTRLQGLGTIDLLGNQSADSLRLDVQQVLDLGQVNWINSLSTALTGGSYHFDSAESRHQLLVSGDAADQLTTTGGLVDTGLTAILSGHTYAVYNQGNFAQLLVEQSINRAAVM